MVNYTSGDAVQNLLKVLGIDREWGELTADQKTLAFGRAAEKFVSGMQLITSEGENCKNSEKLKYSL